MKINWKLRLQNRTTCTAIVVALITCVYSILAALGVTPSVTQEQVTNWAYAAISLLGALGAVVDPTTTGVADSDQALEYTAPRNSSMEPDGDDVPEGRDEGDEPVEGDAE